jgi:succinyl-CoA synthetase alpha subunit
VDLYEHQARGLFEEHKAGVVRFADDPAHIDCLAAFQDDPDTEPVVVIGEIGGDAKERAAACMKEHVTKPVVGHIAGFTAPEGRTMGHAGAIVSGSAGTAQAKKEALEAGGVQVGHTPTETARPVLALLEADQDSTHD